MHLPAHIQVYQAHSMWVGTRRYHQIPYNWSFISFFGCWEHSNCPLKKKQVVLTKQTFLHN